jgi:hypothetical protein
MKTTWEEDPTELLGLEEDEGSNELSGSEFDEDEEDPSEMMGLGEEEGYEDEDDRLRRGGRSHRTVRLG